MIKYYVTNPYGNKYNSVKEVDVEFFKNHIPDFKWLFREFEDREEELKALQIANNPESHYSKNYFHVDTYMEDGYWRVQIKLYISRFDLGDIRLWRKATELMINADRMQLISFKVEKGFFKVYTFKLPFID